MDILESKERLGGRASVIETQNMIRKGGGTRRNKRGGERD